MMRRTIEQEDGTAIHVSGWSAGEVCPYPPHDEPVPPGHHELRIGDGKLGNDWRLTGTRGEVVRICHAMLAAVGATRVDVEFSEARPTLFINGSGNLSASDPDTVERQCVGVLR